MVEQTTSSPEAEKDASLSTAITSLRRSRVSRYAFLLMALLAAFFAFFTLYVLNQSNGSPNPTEILWLVLIDLSLLLGLSLMITSRLFSLIIATKRKAVGSRMQMRIITTFGLVSAVPTIFISVFSILFFNQGIQTWFDDRVSTALEESVAVAQSYLDEHKENIRADILAMSNDLNKQAPQLVQNPALFRQVASTQAALRSLREALIFRGQRNIMAQTDLTLTLSLEVDTLPVEYLQKAANGNVVIFTNKTGDRVRALIKLTHPAFQDEAYLLVGRFIDNKVLEHMKLTQSSNDEYQRLRSSIGHIQVQFSAVFIGIAILILLSALWAGMLFASDMVRPISHLIRTTERVKAGDLEARVNEGPMNDEIATLGRAFNRMTGQVSRQHKELTTMNRKIDERRRFNEAVLSGVSAGIVALNEKQQVTLWNASMLEMFALDPQEMEGKPLTALFPELEVLLAKAKTHENELMMEEVSLIRDNRNFTYLVRVVTETFLDEIEGFVVTFDDVTQLLTAQRSAAWADVARRIAHEIKNPLTPIHLSLDRIRRKYRSSLSREELESLDRYLDTINRHVETIGSIVEEFVKFARMPLPDRKEIDLRNIINDIMTSQSLTHEAITITQDIDDTPLMCSADVGQLGQVLVNLVKNAQEAVEEKRAEGGEIFVKAYVKKHQVIISVDDNGGGFPEHLLNKITEPYVTTKEKGTGLGMAIVKKVVTDHDGTLMVQNIYNDQREPVGAHVEIRLPLVRS